MVPQPRRAPPVAVPAERCRQTSPYSSCEDMAVEEVDRARMLATAPGVDLRAVVLVEGTSDQAAVESLAARRGRDLGAEGICVVPMGGARSIRQFVALFGPLGLDVRLAG